MKENVNIMVLEVNAKSETYFQGLEKVLNHSILVRIYFTEKVTKINTLKLNREKSVPKKAPKILNLRFRI